MADGGEISTTTAHAATAEPGDGVAHPGHRTSLEDIPPIDKVESLLRSRANTPNPFSRQHTSLDIDDYFVSCAAPLLHTGLPFDYDNVRTQLVWRILLINI